MPVSQFDTILPGGLGIRVGFAEGVIYLPGSPGGRKGGIYAGGAIGTIAHASYT